MKEQSEVLVDLSANPEANCQPTGPRKCSRTQQIPLRSQKREAPSPAARCNSLAEIEVIIIRQHHYLCRFLLTMLFVYRGNPDWDPTLCPPPQALALQNQTPAQFRWTTPLFPALPYRPLQVLQVSQIFSQINKYFIPCHISSLLTTSLQIFVCQYVCT